MRMALAVWLVCASAAVSAGEAKPADKPEAPERKSLLWPVFGTKSGKDSKALVVFPLVCYGRKPGESHLIVLPVYARREKDGSKAEVFFPVFARFSGKKSLEPYVSAPRLVKWVDTDEARAIELPGIRIGKGKPNSDDPYTIVDLLNFGGMAKLIEVRRAKDGWSVDFLSVLGGKPAAEAPEPGATVTALTALGVPLAGYRSKPKASAFHLFPILAFGRDEEEERRYFHLWPLFGTTKAGKSRTWTTASPLVARRVEPEKSSFRIFPILWTGKDAKEDEEYIHVWPLIGRHRKGKTHTWSAADPVFVYSHEEGECRYAAAVPLFAYFNQPADGRRGVVALPVVALRKGKEDEEVSDLAVLPLFWLHRDPQRKVKVTQVLPFLWASRRNQSSRGSATAVVLARAEAVARGPASRLLARPRARGESLLAVAVRLLGPQGRAATRLDGARPHQVRMVGAAEQRARRLSTSRTPAPPRSWRGCSRRACRVRTGRRWRG